MKTKSAMLVAITPKTKQKVELCEFRVVVNFVNGQEFPLKIISAKRRNVQIPLA